MPKIHWLHYAANPVAPLRRKRNGSITAVIHKRSVNANGSRRAKAELARQMNHARLEQLQGESREAKRVMFAAEEQNRKGEAWRAFYKKHTDYQSIPIKWEQLMVCERGKLENAEFESLYSAGKN